MAMGEVNTAVRDAEMKALKQEIEELQKKNEWLESDVNALKAKKEFLKGQIEAYKFMLWLKYEKSRPEAQIQRKKERHRNIDYLRKKPCEGNAKHKTNIYCENCVNLIRNKNYSDDACLLDNECIDYQRVGVGESDV